MADFPGNPTPDDDDVLRRVRATLLPLPAHDPQAIARVLGAVHGRSRRRGKWWTQARAWLASLGLSPVSLAGGGSIVVAVIAGVIIVRTSAGRPDTAAMVADGVIGVAAPSAASTHAIAPGTALSPPVVRATAPGDPEAAQPVQFALEAPTATSVSVVGDFNDWNTTAAQMQRLPGAGVWTITLPVQPGRHTYSFVIDGTRWVADPRAPRAVDADFGKPGSVMLVQSR